MSGRIIGGVLLKIKANQNLYRHLLIIFAVIVAFLGSLAYFLGFKINLESLFYYFMFLASVAIFFGILDLIINKCNQTYLIFDEEKVSLEKKQVRIESIYYDRISNATYRDNRSFVDILAFLLESISFGNPEFSGCVDIVYINSDKEIKHSCYFISKKNYKKAFVDWLRIPSAK